MMAKKEPVKCGETVIGWVTVTGCDNYWILATFEKGDGYEEFAAVLESTLSENDSIDAIEKVNELNLKIGAENRLIHDFQMTSPSEVEYKEFPSS